LRSSSRIFYEQSVFVLALSSQSCVNPVLLARSIVPDVGVAQRRQFTGGVLRSISGRVGAVNHDVSRFVRQQCWSKLVDLVGRQIDRARTSARDDNSEQAKSRQAETFLVMA